MMILRVFANNNSAYKEISSLIDKYASGSIIHNRYGLITTDNPLVLFGAINELFSVYSIRKDPANQLELVHKNLSENLNCSFAMNYIDSEEKLIFFVSNNEQFVYKDNKVISGKVNYREFIGNFVETREYVNYMSLNYNLNIAVYD